jgi:thiol-activated cytolysin
MKNRWFFPGTVIAKILILSLFFSCEKEDSFDTVALNEFLKSLPPISDDMPAEMDPVVVHSESVIEQDYVHRTEYFEVTAGYNEQIVLNPQTDVIYPGALVKGESILDGTYTLIPARRKPITISTSLTGASKVSAVVNDPKLSTVREAVNSLMSQSYDVPPANLAFTIEDAYSEQQLNLSLRVSYKTGIANVKAGFNFSNTKIKTRLVAKFIQNYYSLDMDMPSQPSDLFDGDVEQSLFGTYMPMYVSSVTYGRMALFTIESEYDAMEVKAVLNGSYQNITADSNNDFEKISAKSTMKVYILGGSGSTAGATINGFADFKKHVQEGGNYSKASPGAPIAYKLRYIRDNSIGRIVFSANYPITTTFPRTDNMYDIKTRLLKFYTRVTDAGENCELYGNITSHPNGSNFKAVAPHKHFGRTANGHLSIPKWQHTHNFNEDAIQPTVKTTTWKGVKDHEDIRIVISLAEMDDFPAKDDKYEHVGVNIRVSTIVESVNAQGYYDWSKKVHDTGNGRKTEYVEVFFRFTPETK